MITNKMMEKWMHVNGFTFIETLVALANGKISQPDFVQMIRLAEYEDE